MRDSKSKINMMEADLRFIKTKLKQNYAQSFEDVYLPLGRGEKHIEGAYPSHLPFLQH